MTLQAGTAMVDISPDNPTFLWGYPYEPRISTGIHDPLYASVLYLDNNGVKLVLVALDILYISADDTREARGMIADATEIKPENVMITCTHTHSGPVTVDMLFSENDPIVAKVDPKYMEKVRDGILEATKKAIANVRPAEIATTSTMVDGVGCNRHDPDWARDPEVGIIAVRNADDKKLFGLSLIYCMHPTVIHEDIKEVSSDFPGYARIALQKRFGRDLNVIYSNGPQGNQSPRYHVNGQTFAEAERLGFILGDAVGEAVAKLAESDFTSQPLLKSLTDSIVPIRKEMRSLEDAEANFEFRKQDFERLKAEGAPHGPTRTAECAFFGADETLFFAKSAGNGKLDAALVEYKKFEVQVFQIADAFIPAFQGEVFVEYSLDVKKRCGEKVFVVCIANGETQGYITTAEATGYEADNAIFAPATGKLMADKAVELVGKLQEAR